MLKYLTFAFASMMLYVGAIAIKVTIRYGLSNAFPLFCILYLLLLFIASFDRQGSLLSPAPMFKSAVRNILVMVVFALTSQACVINEAFSIYIIGLCDLMLLLGSWGMLLGILWYLYHLAKNGGLTPTPRAKKDPTSPWG